MRAASSAESGSPAAGAWPSACSGCATPHPCGVRQVTGRATPALSAGISLHDILLSGRALQAHNTLGLELPHDGDDLLLGRFHFLDLHWTERVHVLPQHFRAALRHRAEDVILEL